MKFTNLPEFIRYGNFSIDAKKGAHTLCTVRFTIAPEKAEAFLSAAEKRTSTEISSNSGNRVMNGIISAVTVNYSRTETTADVTITSGSLLLQEKGDERIFQDPGKTYRDILKEYPEVEIGICDNLDHTVEEIIYQHNTDDFSFLLYLAERCGCGIWITDEGKLSFGGINSAKTMSEQETVYRKSVLGKKITASKSGREIRLLTMEQMPNGSVLRLDRNGQTEEYRICKVHIYEQYDEPFFEYTGSTEQAHGDAVVHIDNPVKPLFAVAKVTDNKDPNNLGRIQVNFTDFKDEAAQKDHKTWIPYLTGFVGKNNGGAVMIPDIDDEVVVCISEAVAYALNSLRNEPLPENCRDVEKKYFAVKESLITVDGNTVTAAQGDKTVSRLTADHIALEHDKSNFKIDADEIKAGKGNSELALSDKKLSAKNSSSKLNIEGNSAVLSGGGSAKLSLSGGDTKLSGNNIDLSTQGVV